MDNQNTNNPQKQSDENNPLLNDDAVFENPSVDPGFESSEERSDAQLEGHEDQRTGNIDSNKSIKEMREEFDQDQDAMNNEKGDGAYNPSNI